MLNALWGSLALTMWFWLAGVVLSIKGGCQIGLGEEYWDNKECESIYYNFVAPLGTLFLFSSVILCCVFCLRS